MALTITLVLSLMRNSESDFGLKACSYQDWLSVALYVVLMALIVIIATKMTASEQSLKEKYGRINLAKSDLIFRGKVLRNVLILGFGGGWVAGALGLGGGVIFNPLLLSMGVPPKVSSATGMYLITFSKIVTSVLYVMFGELKMDYGLWISAWSILGAVIGLWGANIYMKKSGRQSIIVFFLSLVLALSTIGIPAFGAENLIKRSDNGEDIMAFKSICD